MSIRSIGQNFVILSAWSGDHDGMMQVITRASQRATGMNGVSEKQDDETNSGSGFVIQESWWKCCRGKNRTLCRFVGSKSEIQPIFGR
ncbi:hypothetical protein A6X21_13615 [Planctopirus hydrillae]|uniref:Uncharacterized protein n=1 Tax=Planctopirus hydrillae TaxID=1841610 RepID=A0A1C3E3T9_9PLAN|nr:hypothetical protein A6X21_13615 [Planctopirus hydrillae]